MSEFPPVDRAQVELWENSRKLVQLLQLSISVDAKTPTIKMQWKVGIRLICYAVEAAPNPDLHESLLGNEIHQFGNAMVRLEEIELLAELCTNVLSLRKLNERCYIQFLDNIMTKIEHFTSDGKAKTAEPLYIMLERERFRTDGSHTHLWSEKALVDRYNLLQGQRIEENRGRSSQIAPPQVVPPQLSAEDLANNGKRLKYLATIMREGDTAGEGAVGGKAKAARDVLQIEANYLKSIECTTLRTQHYSDMMHVLRQKGGSKTKVLDMLRQHANMLISACDDKDITNGYLAVELFNYGMTEAPADQKLSWAAQFVGAAGIVLYPVFVTHPSSKGMFLYPWEPTHQRLHQIRDRVREKITAGEAGPEVQAFLTREFLQVFQTLIRGAMVTLPPPDECKKHAFIIFGSAALGAMSPYSDIEFGLLINESDNQTRMQIRQYFTRLLQLLSFRMACLGESPPDVLSGRIGFRLDDGGNIPIGQKSGELMRTPAHMVQNITGQSSLEGGDLMLISSLPTAGFVCGDPELFTQYGQALRNDFANVHPLQEGLIGDVHAQTLLREALGNAEFAPKLLHPGAKPISVKSSLYRIPSMTLTALSLLFLPGEQDRNLFTFIGNNPRLDYLLQMGFISPQLANSMRNMLSHSATMRVKAHMNAETESDKFYLQQGNEKVPEPNCTLVTAPDQLAWVRIFVHNVVPTITTLCDYMHTLFVQKIGQRLAQGAPVGPGYGRPIAPFRLRDAQRFVETMMHHALDEISARGDYPPAYYMLMGVVNSGLAARAATQAGSDRHAKLAAAAANAGVSRQRQNTPTIINDRSAAVFACDLQPQYLDPFNEFLRQIPPFPAFAATQRETFLTNLTKLDQDTRTCQRGLITALQLDYEMLFAERHTPIVTPADPAKKKDKFCKSFGLFSGDRVLREVKTLADVIHPAGPSTVECLAEVLMSSILFSSTADVQPFDVVSLEKGSNKEFGPWKFTEPTLRQYVYPLPMGQSVSKLDATELNHLDESWNPEQYSRLFINTLLLSPDPALPERLYMPRDDAAPTEKNTCLRLPTKTERDSLPGVDILFCFPRMMLSLIAPGARQAILQASPVVVMSSWVSGLKRWARTANGKEGCPLGPMMQAINLRRGPQFLLQRLQEIQAILTATPEISHAELYRRLTPEESPNNEATPLEILLRDASLSPVDRQNAMRPMKTMQAPVAIEQLRCKFAAEDVWGRFTRGQAGTATGAVPGPAEPVVGVDMTNIVPSTQVMVPEESVPPMHPCFELRRLNEQLKNANRNETDAITKRLPAPESPMAGSPSGSKNITVPMGNSTVVQPLYATPQVEDMTEKYLVLKRSDAALTIEIRAGNAVVYFGRAKEELLKIQQDENEAPGIVVIDDPGKTVSGIHCKMYYHRDSGDFMVEGFPKLNGTHYSNNFGRTFTCIASQKVAPVATALRGGYMVRLGRVEFRVDVTNSPSGANQDRTLAMSEGCQVEIVQGDPAYKGKTFIVAPNARCIVGRKDVQEEQSVASAVVKHPVFALNDRTQLVSRQHLEISGDGPTITLLKKRGRRAHVDPDTPFKPTAVYEWVQVPPKNAQSLQIGDIVEVMNDPELTLTLRFLAMPSWEESPPQPPSCAVHTTGGTMVSWDPIYHVPLLVWNLENATEGEPGQPLEWKPIFQGVQFQYHHMRAHTNKKEFYRLQLQIPQSAAPGPFSEVVSFFNDRTELA